MCICYNPAAKQHTRIAGGLATISRISKHKPAAEAAHASDDKYRLLMEQASDGIHTYDLQGNFLEVNSKLCEMLGYTRAELLRLNVNDLIPAADRAAMPLRLAELCAGQTIISERRVRRKDGTLLPVEISGKLVQAGVLQAIIRDITERKRAEQQLKEREEWWRAIFAASRDGILVEADERIVYVNQAYTLQCGYNEPAELIGQPVAIVLPVAEQARMAEYGHRRLRGELVPTVYEFKGRRKDGQLIDLEAAVSLSNVGGKAYITTAIRDIAERKQAEAALKQAHDELEQRVVERTAELAKTNAALQAEIVERQQAEEARKTLLRRLVTAQEAERRRLALELHDQMGQDLTALILGLKTMKTAAPEDAAAQARLGQLQTLTEQLEQKVRTLAWELRPPMLDDLGLHTALYNYAEKWAEQAQVMIDFHSSGLEDQRLPPHVETTLYRLVQEALTNVHKHAQADSVSLIVERRNDHVQAIVEDNGLGFEVEATWPAPGKERRLGLLGMRERVELIGGTLNVESTAGGGGTTVFVRIPLPEQPGEQHA